MLNIQEAFSLKKKTTMKIGGTARAYAEVRTREDLEAAVAEAQKRNLPMIMIGGGSNTIFADGEIEAFVVKITADTMKIENTVVEVEAGKILAVLINELAANDLDLSALTGIPGSVGGALFGNAGQGPQGIWIDSFVNNVTAFVDGAWKTLTKEECRFRYRESWFKDEGAKCKVQSAKCSPIIWSATFKAPRRPNVEVLATVEELLQKRIATQPHRQTAGSCFKAVGGTPAWKLIDAVGLRGLTIGGVQVSEKHANFLLNTGTGSFADALAVIERVEQAVSEPLEIEMRLYRTRGNLAR